MKILQEGKVPQLHHKDRTGRSILHYACLYGNLRVCLTPSPRPFVIDWHAQSHWSFFYFFDYCDLCITCRRWNCCLKMTQLMCTCWTETTIHACHLLWSNQWIHWPANVEFDPLTIYCTIAISASSISWSKKKKINQRNDLKMIITSLTLLDHFLL
jgi:hypothetical protein